MNRLQYLLIKLAEESSEVGQIALKTAQFGLHEVYSENGKSNIQRIHDELNDLFGIIKMLNVEYEFDYTPSDVAISDKIEKVSKYFNYSCELGHVK